MTVGDFAQRSTIAEEELRAVLREQDPAPLTDEMAGKIAALIPNTRNFWIARERIYRREVARVAALWARRRSTVFVSGHLDLTEEEFREHYGPRILEAHAQGWDFAVGDARGTDQMTQDFLKRMAGRVTVYHMGDAPRYNAGFPTVGRLANDEERDAAMTCESARDIAWVRPGREKSGTARNLARRAEG